MFGITFIFPFRLIGMLVVVLSYLFSVQLITLGHDMSKPFTRWRRICFTLVNKTIPRLALACAGYLKVDWKYRDDYDYSKWLGKEYNKPHFAVSSVSNHSAWTDLFIMILRSGGVSFVSKDSIKRTPLFGRVGIALNSIFFSRTGTKEEKERVAEEISARQKAILAANGECNNLHIFPEGLTTNNTHLLPFKRGVFQSLLPIRPLCVKYSSSYFNPAHDVMPMHIHFVVLLSQIVNYVEVTQMPIFEPNRYLFENHQKAGQLEWEIFAHAVRECMSDVSGLPTSEATIQQKNDCKSAYFGSKAKID